MGKFGAFWSKNERFLSIFSQKSANLEHFEPKMGENERFWSILECFEPKMSENERFLRILEHLGAKMGRFTAKNQSFSGNFILKITKKKGFSSKKKKKKKKKTPHPQKKKKKVRSFEKKKKRRAPKTKKTDKQIKIVQKNIFSMKKKETQRGKKYGKASFKTQKTGKTR
jgi:hypothetical protein